MEKAFPGTGTSRRKCNLFTQQYLLGHYLSMLITVSACRTDGKS